MSDSLYAQLESLTDMLTRGVVGFILGGALGPIQSVFPLFVVLC